MDKMAVVLAAGNSTRLMPLTKETPKPMLLVNGRPILAFVIDWLRKNKIKKIIITTHYHPEKIINYFGDGSNYEMEIYYSYEDSLLETAGSLKKIEHFLKNDFLVLSGSYYLPSLNLTDFWNYHEKQGGIGTIAFYYSQNNDLNRNFGQGICDDTQRLIYFEEKPKNAISYLIHTTYQIYTPAIFRYIPRETSFSIPLDLIPLLLQVDEKIFSYILPPEATLMAVSTKRMYEQAQRYARAS